MTRFDGSQDIERAANSLAERLPTQLTPFARIAYNYLWSWDPGARDLFRRIDPQRFDLCNENPVRLLTETSAEALQRTALDAGHVRDAEQMLGRLSYQLGQPGAVGKANAEHPIAFLCAEFAVHRSLPIYAGGLGALAGDILKEASDMGLPMVGVGLLYRDGYFMQRIDHTGYQHEYWRAIDPDRLPMALVRDAKGNPLTVSVPVRGHDIVVQIWRVEVGRVPLYLLDAARPENSRIDRWITGRLYVGDRAVRLAQYALLGIGSIRALRAMGMDPAIVHLNEGHGALAPLELAHEAISRGTDRGDAFNDARDRTIFTTHTPVAAGNEGYAQSEIDLVLGEFPREVGLDRESFLQLGRTHSDNPTEDFVMTPLGIKMSRFANGVSKRHGEVSRQMWQPLFPERPVETVPIHHVTNGVHLPTWMALPMRRLLDKYLGEDWTERAAEPGTWNGVDRIPDAELWEVRNQLRRDFMASVRERTIANRLERNEPRDYVEAVEHGFNDETLTLGFARRLAGYKRLYLLTLNPQRVAELLADTEHPMQLILAGKAHPNDEDGKHSPETLFAFKRAQHAGERVSFLDNYDLGIAAEMVSGCDLWVNVPRPPLEASGTSGMKAAMNGALNFSVLDGWWAEAFDGNNGWAIPGDVSVDASVQDQRDAAAFYDILQHEIAPLFYDRDAEGIPHRWVARIKASLKTNGPGFCATRMLNDYLEAGYALVTPEAARAR